MTLKGKALFADHLSGWMTKQGLNPTVEPVAAVAAKAQREILADIRSGAVPVTVRSFAQLHDYVDANSYGGGFDWPCLPSETEDDAYQQAFTDFWNAVQGRVDHWIKSGQIRAEATKGRTR